jgi:hypothetical protein
MRPGATEPVPDRSARDGTLGLSRQAPFQARPELHWALLALHRPREGRVHERALRRDRRSRADGLAWMPRIWTQDPKSSHAAPADVNIAGAKAIRIRDADQEAVSRATTGHRALGMTGSSLSLRGIHPSHPQPGGCRALLLTSNARVAACLSDYLVTWPWFRSSYRSSSRSCPSPSSASTEPPAWSPGASWGRS